MQKLYHAVWELVRDTFYDTSRLTNWSSWEHRFDDKIHDEADALRCIDEMLASLGDTYTERVVPPAVTASAASTENASAPQEVPPPVLAVCTPSNLGYLAIRTFDREDIMTFIKAGVEKISGCDGIILDLRNNSGGRMHQALEACNFFIVNGVLASLKMRYDDGVHTRTYMVCDTQFYCSNERADGTGTTELYERHEPVLAGKPLVILMNSGTASAGELMLAALVQNGTEGAVSIVGSGQTPGKGIGQAEYEVEGIKVRVTRTHWFAPGGDWLGDCGQTESNGIEPWVNVENDRGPEGLKVASDELCKMLGRDKTTSAA
jgi:C-terminal processing protease CtpA/Prc